MSCNFCRDSIEGLKEIPLTKPVHLTAVSTAQGMDVLAISPDFVKMGGSKKLYQCQWCTEYWCKKSKLNIIQVDPGKGVLGAGLEFNITEEAVPMGHNLDKIREDLS